jgi:hypothetical protein
VARLGDHHALLDHAHFVAVAVAVVAAAVAAMAMPMPMPVAAVGQRRPDRHGGEHSGKE